MAHPVKFFAIQAVAWVIVVGGWLNMDCEVGDWGRIASYTVGLVIFSVVFFVNYSVNLDS